MGTNLRNITLPDGSTLPIVSATGNGPGGEIDWPNIYAAIGLLGILSFLGTIGNALVVAVFSRRVDNQTSTIFIVALAVVDMLTCAIILPITMFFEYVQNQISNDAMCKLYIFLTTSNVPYSAFVMTAIAVDRYLCICHPFLHLMTIPRAKVIIALLGLLAALTGIIAALLHGTWQERLFVECINTPDISNYRLNLFFRNMSATYRDLDLCTIPDGYVTNVTKMNIKVLKIKVNTNSCGSSYKFFSIHFMELYKKVHYSQFLICLLIIIVLYVLIYKSVLDRRRKRAKMKNSNAYSVREPTVMQETEGTQLTAAVNGHKSVDHETFETKKLKRKSTKKDKNRMQNVKTAVMLFVVTVVFIITFVPAGMMANGFIPYQPFVFYCYFANNVANPVIYAFMNSAFRTDLKKIFWQR